MRSARPRALLSNNPLLAVLGVVFLVGALLLALGTFLVRREAKAQTFETREESSDIVQEVFSIADAVAAFEHRVVPAEPAATPSQLRVTAASQDGLEARLDHIERLMIVGQPWCVEELEHDFLNDGDDQIRAAAQDALLVIRSRV